MRQSDSPVRFLGQACLDRLADKHALDTYLRKRKEPAANLRFLMTPVLREAVNNLVEDLPELDRLLVRMRFWDDLSIEEIADILKEEPMLVQQHLTSVLAALRKKIIADCEQHIRRQPFKPFIAHDFL